MMGELMIFVGVGIGFILGSAHPDTPTVVIMKGAALAMVLIISGGMICSSRERKQKKRGGSRHGYEHKAAG